VQTVTLTSVAYLGALVGTVFSGVLGDIVGRRLPILLSYPVIILFSLLSAPSHSFHALLAIRLFVGLGFGLGQPNAITLLVEVTPPKWRILNQGLAQVAFALGELFCCIIITFVR
jgi:MFS family permease